MSKRATTIPFIVEPGQEHCGIPVPARSQPPSVVPQHVRLVGVDDLMELGKYVVLNQRDEESHINMFISFNGDIHVTH